MPFFQRLKELFTKPEPSPTQSPSTYFLTPTNDISAPMSASNFMPPVPMTPAFTPFIPSEYPNPPMPFMPQPVLNGLEMYGPGTPTFETTNNSFNPLQFNSQTSRQSVDERSLRSTLPTPNFERSLRSNLPTPDFNRNDAVYRTHARPHRHHKVRSVSRSSRHRNYSAEWAINHPEVLTDFFVKSPKKRDQTLSPFNDDFISVRTVKEKRQRKSHKGRRKTSTERKSRRDSGRRATFTPNDTDENYREPTQFRWKPSPRQSSDTKDQTDTRSELSYDALQLNDTDSTPILSPPKAPHLPTNMKPPNSKSPAIDKNIYGSTRQNKIYENVVGELKDKITKLQHTGTSQEGIDSVAPSNFLNRAHKVPPPPVRDLKTPNAVSTADDSKQNVLSGIKLRHVSPPPTPQLGRVVPPPRPSPPKNYASSSSNIVNLVNLNNPLKLPDNETSSSFEDRFAMDKLKQVLRTNDYANTHKSSNRSTEKNMEKTFLKSVENILMNKKGSRIKQPDGTEWEVIVLRPENSSEYESGEAFATEISSTDSVPSVLKSRTAYINSSIFENQSNMEQFSKKTHGKEFVSVHDFIDASAHTR